MKYNLFLLFLILLPLMGAGQERPEKEYKWAIKAGYFGEFVLHPGIYAGSEYNISQKKWLTLHWDSELGGYIHKWNNNSLFLQSSIGTRFTTKFAAFFDLNMGVGYMLSTPNGDLYEASESGQIQKGKRPISTHFKPSFALLLGWDGRKNRGLPFKLHLGLETYMQSHVNHSMLPHAAMRLGFTYQLRK